MSAVVDLKIDRSNRTERDGSQYFVVFCARAGSLTGHGFVLWGTHSGTNRMSEQAVFGFYPAADLKPVFGRDVPGEVRDEALKESGVDPFKTLTHRLIIKVDKEVFLASQKEISKWETRDFNLYRRNCLSFLHAVLEHCIEGASPPNSGEFPSSYLGRIIARVAEG